MSILTNIESSWLTHVWNDANVQALTDKIYQYPVTTESEYEIAKLYYNQEVNFFEVLTGGFVGYLSSSGSIGLVYKYNITVEVNYYLELDTTGDNFTTVREALLTVFDLVSTELGFTWGDNVEIWQPEESIPTIVEATINNKKCWKGTSRYFAEKTVELSGNPGNPGPVISGPDQIPNLVRWYKIENAVEYGDFVTALVDSSESNQPAITATSSNRPQYFTNLGYNDKPILGFDGGDDTFTFETLNLDSGFTIFACGAWGGLMDQNAIFGNSGGVFNSFRLVDDTHSVIQYDNGLSDNYTHSNISTGEIEILCVDSNREMYVNGVLATRTGGATGAQDFRLDSIGSTGLISYMLTSLLGELIIFNAVLTAEQRSQVGQYLADQYARNWA